MTSKIPRGPNIPAESKKTRHDHKETTAGFVHKADAKAQRENEPKKAVVHKAHKGISSRYGQQVELKEQNQLLVSEKEELQRNLAEVQHRVAELESQFNELQKENSEARKNLQNCHALLVSAKIDPVLGAKAGDIARQNDEERKQVMSVSSDLLKELEAFGEVASKQRARLQEMQTGMEDLAEARELMKRERESFALQAADLEKVLKQAEELVL